jgi:hypothetical protein
LQNSHGRPQALTNLSKVKFFILFRIYYERIVPESTKPWRQHQGSTGSNLSRAGAILFALRKIPASIARMKIFGDWL